MLRLAYDIPNSAYSGDNRTFEKRFSFSQSLICVIIINCSFNRIYLIDFM